MKDNYPDIIILTGVPKGEGLHGLTPTKLPKVQISPDEKIVSSKGFSLLKFGLFSALVLLIGKIFK